jgi:four helix bundle protein
VSSRNYQDLRAWQKAIDLVLLVYEYTQTWPANEMYGLAAQVRRAAVSVPSNIAEGQGRRTVRDFVRFLNIAHGSLREVETQLLIAQRLGYLSEQQFDCSRELSSEAGRLITGLANSLSTET